MERRGSRSSQRRRSRKARLVRKRFLILCTAFPVLAAALFLIISISGNGEKIPDLPGTEEAVSLPAEEAAAPEFPDDDPEAEDGSDEAEINVLTADADTGTFDFDEAYGLAKDKIARAILYAWQNGMEIENHTYSHNHVRMMDQERLMTEIRAQSRALEEALGVSYQEHFLRLPGGDEHNDQRVHAAAAQQGITALAHWSVSGSGLGVSACLKKLKPGAIYLLHTTDKDTEKLISFIPAAVEQGYTLVTLNEMFGLPENETAPLAERSAVPALEPFRIMVGYLPNYSHGGALIQQRLHELGYLSEEADGIIGEVTREALRSFRADHGMSREQYWDEKTAKALFEGLE